jgi:hypothetical protein
MHVARWAALALACCSPSSPPEAATTYEGGSADAQLDPHDGSAAADRSTRDSNGAVVVDADAALGLRATFFRRHGALTLERVDPTVDFVWGNGGPATSVGVDHFSARWEGTLDVPVAGDYTFVVRADDGVRLWIGDVRLIDQWVFHDLARYEATATLAEGPVALRLEYFEKDLAGVRGAPRMELGRMGRDDHSRRTTAPCTRGLRRGVAQASLRESGHTHQLPGSRRARHRRQPTRLLHGLHRGSLPHTPLGGTRLLGRHRLESLSRRQTALGAQRHARLGARNPSSGESLHHVLHRDRHEHCRAIGAASATAPLGPYTDVGAPLVQDPLGVIDATYFADDDARHYLFYRSTAIHRPSRHRYLRASSRPTASRSPLARRRDRCW